MLLSKTPTQSNLWQRHLRAAAAAATVATLLGLTAATLHAEDTPEELIKRPSEANETIRELARHVRIAVGGTKNRLERLIDVIFAEKKGLGFEYRARPTLTAAEAVEAKAGNCLSLVNLAVSLARSAGIEAEYVEVEDFQEFYRYRETIVRTTHVITGVNVSGRMMYIDFLPRRDKPYRSMKPISDRRAAALFYNALASEALLDKDYARAEEHFRDAFAVDETAADTWNNYAVFQRRQGDLAAAITSLERAHALEPELLPAIENLAAMLQRAGRLDEAEKFEALARAEKTKNPYFLLQQALERLELGESVEAEQMLRRARRLKPDEPEIYLALGRIELERGDQKAAKKLFAEARRKSAPSPARFQELLQKKIDALLGDSSHEDES